MNPKTNFMSLRNLLNEHKKTQILQTVFVDKFRETTTVRSQYLKDLFRIKKEMGEIIEAFADTNFRDIRKALELLLDEVEKHTDDELAKARLRKNINQLNKIIGDRKCKN